MEPVTNMALAKWFTTALAKVSHDGPAELSSGMAAFAGVVLVLEFLGQRCPGFHSSRPQFPQSPFWAFEESGDDSQVAHPIQLEPNSQPTCPKIRRFSPKGDTRDLETDTGTAPAKFHPAL